MLSRWVVLAGAALAAACNSRKAPEPAAAAQVAPSSVTIPPRPSDPVAAARAFGPFHREPIHYPSDDAFHEQWLALIGPPEVAEAAWVLTPAAKASTVVPIQEWPVGVRVIGPVPDAPYVLVESLAALDQPAGLRGAISAQSIGELADVVLFAGVRDAEDARARLEKAPEAHADAPEGARDTALADARATPLALSKALAKGGADVWRVWQSTFAQSLGKVDAASILKSPHVERMLEVLRAVNPSACDPVCEAVTDDGERQGAVVIGREEGRTVIRGFFLLAPAAAPPSKAKAGAARVIAAAATTTATADVLRPRVNRTIRILGEAPLHPSDAKRGSIGVAVVEVEEPPNVTPPLRRELVLAVSDGAGSRVFELGTTTSFTIADAASVAVRFADVDGDDRTDFVLHVPADSGAKFHVFRAPADTIEADRMATPDEASKLALLGAADLDAATTSALAVANRGATPTEVCKLLAGGFRSAAAPNARVLTYELPGDIAHESVSTKVGEPRALEILRTHATDFGEGCPALTCVPGRPVCYRKNGPATTYYFLAWAGADLRLAAVAFYGGT